MLKLFGIPNCDTVKKTRKWLDTNKLKYEFHDYKKRGISKKQLTDWCKLIDWELLLNKRSRTWKELNEEQRSNLSQTKAIKLMQQYPTLIKRPVVQRGRTIEVGFNSKAYTKQFK